MKANTETIWFAASQPSDGKVMSVQSACRLWVPVDYDQHAVCVITTHADGGVLRVALSKTDDANRNQTARRKATCTARWNTPKRFLMYKVRTGPVRTLAWRSRGETSNKSSIDRGSFACIGHGIAEMGIRVIGLHSDCHSPPCITRHNGHDGICARSRLRANPASTHRNDYRMSTRRYCGVSVITDRNEHYVHNNRGVS